MVALERHIRMFITHMMCLKFIPVHNTLIHSNHPKVIYDCATVSLDANYVIFLPLGVER